jgi:hypothetical protein
MKNECLLQQKLKSRERGKVCAVREGSAKGKCGAIQRATGYMGEEGQRGAAWGR